MNNIIRFTAAVAAFAMAAGAQESAPEHGFRERLEHRGVSIGASYTAEGFTDGRAGDYLGSISTRLLIDLKRMRVARGQLFIGVQDVHGQGVNDRFVGAIQAPSNLEGQRFRKLAEAWYSDSYFDQRLRVKAGRQYADSEFGVIESGGDFLNSAFGVVPTAPMPTYPNPELGVSVWAAPARRVSFGAGAYRAGNITGARTFSAVESKLQLTRLDTFRAGWWGQGANHGSYLAAEHHFAAEGESVPAVFARFGKAPAARNSLVSYAGAGAVFGKFGAGITSVRPVGGKREVVCEMFFKHRFGGRFAIQPDLQWLANPSGNGPRRVLAGLRFTAEL
jgi:carbohydrate-selective porin OprB